MPETLIFLKSTQGVKTVGTDDTDITFTLSPALSVPRKQIGNLIQRNFATVEVVEINNISTAYNMSKIPLDSAVMTYVYLADPNPIRYTFPSPADTFSTIRIAIKDADGGYFDLRGIPWSLSLRATT
jgi:hypothetical protein